MLIGESGEAVGDPGETSDVPPSIPAPTATLWPGSFPRGLMRECKMPDRDAAAFAAPVFALALDCAMPNPAVPPLAVCFFIDLIAEILLLAPIEGEYSALPKASEEVRERYLPGEFNGGRMSLSGSFELPVLEVVVVEAMERLEEVLDSECPGEPEGGETPPLRLEYVGALGRWFPALACAGTCEGSGAREGVSVGVSEDAPGAP